MSTPDRREMLDRSDKTLSIRRQCTLVGVARSGFYRPSKRQRFRSDAAHRRVIHGMAFSRFAAHDGDAAGGRREDQPQAGAALDAPDGNRRARAKAEYDEAGARPQDLSLSATELEDRAAKPRLGGRYNLCAHRTRLFLPRRDHRLVKPRGSGLARLKYNGHFVLPRRAR